MTARKHGSFDRPGVSSGQMKVRRLAEIAERNHKVMKAAVDALPWNDEGALSEAIGRLPSHPRAENSTSAQRMGLVLLLRVRIGANPETRSEEEDALFGDLDTGVVYRIPFVED